MNHHTLKLIYIAIFTALDVIITTVLYGHGSDLQYYFVTDIRFFKIDQSFLELWAFSWCRFIVTFGAAAGIVKNAKDAVERIEWSHLIIFFISASMWSYAIVKMLMYSQTDASWDKDAWFWCLFTWTIIASIMFYLHWSQMMVTLKPDEKDIKSSKQRSSLSGRSNVNCVEDDVERLIDKDDDDSAGDAASK